MVKHLKSLPKSVLAMLAAALILLAFSTVGGARAALKYFSEIYTGQFNTYHIGIQLRENGHLSVSKNWSSGDWAVEGNSKILGDITSFEFGKTYKEELTVLNTGGISEYVRATIYKYWVDADGNKQVDLAPSYIQLELNTDEGWIKDPAYSETADHPERIVMYYTEPLAVGDETSAFMKSIKIDPAVKAVASQTTSTKTVEGKTVTTITTTYTYDDKFFAVEVQVDGVQTHNAEDAIKSAWGRDVTIAGTTLSLD